MTIRLFSEMRNLEEDLRGRKHSVELLDLDFEGSRVEVVEEPETAAAGSLSFLGTVVLPRRIRLVSIPVRGNPDLLRYAPPGGALLQPLEGILEEGILVVKWMEGDPAPLFAYLKDQQGKLNRIVEEHNKRGLLL